MRVPSPAASTIARHVRRGISCRLKLCWVHACHTSAGSLAKDRRARPFNQGEGGICRILLVFSMIRPSRSPWRSSRRRRKPICVALTDAVANVNTLLWLCGWGGITTVALIILAITSQTETASERLRHIFAVNEFSAIAQMSPRVAQLETETRCSGAQVRALTVERDRLAGRIALLESSIDDMTGAIKKQAAATTAALAAKPASDTERTAASRSPRRHPGCGIAERATPAPPPKARRPHTQASPVAAGPRRVRVNEAGTDRPPKAGRIRSRSWWRQRRSIAVRQRWSNGEGQFRAAVERDVSARGTRPSRRRVRLSAGGRPFAE